MTFQQPEIVEHDKSLLFLAENWVSATSGTGLTVTVWRTPGTLVEADVTDTEGNTLLRERIDMRAMLTGWLADLLNRAGEGLKK